MCTISISNCWMPWQQNTLNDTNRPSSGWSSGRICGNKTLTRATCKFPCHLCCCLSIRPRTRPHQHADTWQGCPAHNSHRRQMKQGARQAHSHTQRQQQLLPQPCQTYRLPMQEPGSRLRHPLHSRRGSPACVLLAFYTATCKPLPRFNQR